MLITSIAFSLLTIAGHAQQSWVWDSYDIAVDLPTDFKLSKNTDNEFEAIGEGMELAMFIFEEDITLGEMKEARVLDKPAYDPDNLKLRDVVPVA